MTQERIGAVCSARAGFGVRDSSGIFIFTDSSSGANRYFWRFGDGNYAYSAGNQTHAYAKSSSRYYYVYLEVWDTTQSNCSDTFVYMLYVPGCNASATFASSVFGYLATFTNYGYWGFKEKWYFGDGNTSTAHSPTHTYSSLGTYTVKLVVQDTSNAGCKDSMTKSVVINGCIVDAKFTHKDSNGVHYFTNNSTGGANKFLWEFGDGNTSTAVNPTHTYSTNGFYRPRLHAYDSTINGCEDTMIWFVQSGCLASASFTYYRSWNTIQFYHYNDNAIPYSSFYWDFGNGQTSTAENPSITYSSAGVYTVYLVVVDSRYPNCRDSVAMQVYPIICNTSASFTYTKAARKVTFSNTSTNATSYQWYFGSSAYSTTKNPVYIFPSNGTYLVTMIAYDSTGNCRDTIRQYITISGCSTYTLFSYNKSGLQVSFYNSSGGSKLKYLWDFGDGQTSSAKNPVHTYGSTGSYSVMLKAWDSTNSWCRDSTNQLVSVSPCKVSAYGTYIDSMNLIWFYNFSTNANKYLWNFGDGNTSTQQLPTHAYSGSARYIGVYLVAWDTNYSNCKDSFWFTIWYPGCNSYFTIEPDTSNQFSALVVNRSRTGSNATYMWYFGDGDSSSSRTPSHTYAGTGPYTLCLHVIDSGCSSWFCDTLGFDSSGNILAMRPFSIRVVEPGKYYTTSISEAELPKTKIYPNPTQNGVKIESAELITEIRICDVQGKMIYTINPLGNLHYVEMQGWSPGVYIVTIKYNGNRQERVKLIKN